ncbi:MAG: hypothetical protein AAFO89_05410, partial [Planctomycetota bacterium]
MTNTPPTPQATGWRLQTPNALVWLRLGLAAVFFALLSRWSPGRESDADPMLLIAAGLFVVA